MKNKIIHVVKGRAVEMISIISALLLWQLVAEFIVRNKFFLPSILDVISASVTIFQRPSILELGSLAIEMPVIFIDLLHSLLHFSIGMVAALIIGIPIGMMMGWFTTFNRMFDPIIEMLRPIPPLAWIPFAIIWLGLTPVSAGFLIFIGAVFPIIINTFTGLKNVPKVYVEAARVLGCKKDRDLIRYIAMPSALPSIAAGIRIAIGVGWMCLVAAEMFGVSKYGLGFKIWHHYYLHQMDMVLVYMVVLGLLGLLIDKVLRYVIDEHLLKWQAGVVR
ncbi:MAG: taurine transporter subunit [Methanomethylovorans sp. PtaU1.Bin093]|jgi:NitT/TauT family transport system permease protein|uniref:ABC transporter permease n=1 Tax=Methanomethylovorans sp. PtaU1.Bin093 TaxID=1811679 RepID=UPI0009C5E0D8|nr:ABC transporter permease [Methanomethylovorans sp. PtaU1.Bin093]OPY21183.1 MAG: taurine transporter subunit [Methanomethylovorans sp. PtaU1.Bin093]